MSFKSLVINEVQLNETPDDFQKVVNEQLEKSDDCKLIKVTKKVEYPYKDETKELVVYKAYIASFNLMTLLTKFGFSDRVNVDSMVIGDCKVFLEYWNGLGY